MVSYPEIKMYIGGAWRTAPGAEILNPFDESVLGVAPHARRADLDDALDAAEKAFRLWRATSPARRARIIMKAAEIIRARSAEMGEVMTLEQGKTLDSAKMEVARCYGGAEWNAAEGQRLYGRLIAGEPGVRNTVRPEPIGVAAQFTPWNYPVSSPAGKIASALAAGCTVILKASEETPAGAVQVVQAYHEAGAPPGVVNLVFGVPSEISEYLIPHPAVKIIGFTGSTAVGRRLGALAGAHIKPAVLELGGHAPVIVCDDVDPAAVAAESIAMKARNAGQICVSPTRFFVEEAVYDRFLAALVEGAKAVSVGNGLDAAIGMGPLANARRLEAVTALVDDARAKGAKVLTGGARLGNQGYLYPLTVLSDVPDDAAALHDEPFGPIALVTPVRDLDEALVRSNRTPYGLAAYAFTRSAVKVDRIVEGLEVGNIGLNQFAAAAGGMTFGGVKDSGFGREGGTEGVEHYTVLKGVSHRVEFPARG
jgi:succinate-semialdehyde dehydrogenase/glutarate-semialdehyde dehydrogenase